MVIMALDHTRDYFSNASPMNFATTTPILFFTRWITHFCAPIFVFLSGTSIYLQSLRKTKKELQRFLLKRGVWLILVEVVVITFGWTFNLQFSFIILQVIWAIGISMVILGCMIRLPFTAILITGSIIVLCHNLLDIPESAPGFIAGFWWDLLHHGSFALYPVGSHFTIIILYPFVPWAGLMMMGYCTGTFFSVKYSVPQRRKIFNRIGASLILAFTVLRLINAYGNPEPWNHQKNVVFTVLSFINVHKYPPSLMYLCMTIGPAFLLLSFFEGVQNRLTSVMRIFGRVAFFYYILHIYFIHLLSMIFFLARGHSMAQGTDTSQGLPFFFLAAKDGYSLPVVYLLWVLAVIALFPLCRWYNDYKSGHREKWWLSYL